MKSSPLRRKKAKPTAFQPSSSTRHLLSRYYMPGAGSAMGNLSPGASGTGRGDPPSRLMLLLLQWTACPGRWDPPNSSPGQQTGTGLLQEGGVMVTRLNCDRNLPTTPARETWRPAQPASTAADSKYTETNCSRSHSCVFKTATKRTRGTLTDRRQAAFSIAS